MRLKHLSLQIRLSLVSSLLSAVAQAAGPRSPSSFYLFSVVTGFNCLVEAKINKNPHLLIDVSVIALVSAPSLLVGLTVGLVS